MIIKQRKGISLITLIITIVVVIILAAAVILMLTGNNPINNARVANLISTKDSIESAVLTYDAKVKSKVMGEKSTYQIITGENDSEEYRIIEKDSEGTLVTCEVTKNTIPITLYKIDESLFKEKIDKLPAPPNRNGAWYLDEDGHVFLVFDEDGQASNWMTNKEKKIDDATLLTFVVYKGGEIGRGVNSGKGDAGKKDNDNAIKFPPYTDSDWFAYEVNSDGDLVLTGFNSEKLKSEPNYPTTIHFPKTIDGKKVVAVKDDAFRGKNKIESLYVTEGITSIGHRAFRDCTALKEVYLPTTLTYMSHWSDGDATFYNCKSIEKITIPQYVVSNERAASNMFISSRSSIKEINFCGEVTYLGNYAFAYFDGLDSIDTTNVKMPSTITLIGDNAFNGCKGALSITVPNFVTEIGTNTFQNCSNVTEVHIPTSVKKIGNGSFQNCTSLTNIDIKADGTTIGDDTFRGCTALVNLKVTEGVTSIGHRAFRDCTALKEVYLPTTLTYMSHWNDGDATFYNCKNIEKITIPQYVVSNERAASNMFISSRSSIKEINFCGEVTYLGNYAFAYFDGLDSIDTTNVKMPSTITLIGDNAFNGCKGALSITVPNFVTEIGTNTFQNCSNVTDVHIPTSVKKIGNGSFQNCTSLTNIDIKADETTIGDDTFRGCTALVNLKVTEGVTSIGHRAFRECTALKDVYLPTTLTYMSHWSDGDATFYNCKNIEKITIPQYVVSNERAASNMFLYSNSSIKEVNFCGKITYLGNYALARFNGLTSIDLNNVKIPNTVTLIGNNAFNGCAGAKSITIPDFVTEIGTNAFQNCSNATDVHISTSVKKIGNGSFQNCTSLTNIDIKSDGTTIGDDTFRGCTALVNLNVPEGVTSVGHRAFRECTALKEVYLPTTLTYISHWTDGDATFYNCKSIEKVTVPQYIANGERRISNVFNYSKTTLKNIYLHSNVSSIASDSLNGISDATIYYKNSLPSGSPWGGSNITSQKY